MSVKKVFKVVDLFCGAGGTSTGAVQAIEKRGARVELLAVNHWPTAIETHSRNHPTAKHLCKSLDQVRPREAVRGEVDLLVASPECTHHSIARGGKPINDQSRMSAFEVLRWVAELLPRQVLIENVKEFETWGPIGVNKRPIQSRKGETFRTWLQMLQSLGYRVDRRVLNAANYGAATTRERLYIRAVRGRAPLDWPTASHSQAGGADLFGSTLPWRPAREIIDWSMPSRSIFTRKKPLAPATLERIAAGLRKFGGRHAEPFLVVLRNNQNARSLGLPVPTMTTSGANFGLCEPFVVPFFGERRGQQPRVHSLHKPLQTVTGQGAGGLVQPYIVQFNGDRPRDMERSHHVGNPLPTVTAGGNRFGLVEPFIMPVNHGGKDHRAYSVAEPMRTVTTVDAWSLVEPQILEYYGTGETEPVSNPLRTITTKDRFGLVEFDGMALDIHFRMLQPHELAAAMGFPACYQFAGNREEQVKQIGNAVEVNQAEALVDEALFGAGGV